MKDDLRKQSRVPLSLDVISEADAGKYEARTSDISLSGCFVDSVIRVEPGETIRLKLRLPGGDWIRIEGVVAYTHPTIGFGVRFVQIAPAEETKLKKLLADRESQ